MHFLERKCTKFHWSLFVPKCPINNISAQVQIMAPTRWQTIICTNDYRCIYASLGLNEFILPFPRWLCPYRGGGCLDWSPSHSPTVYTSKAVCMMRLTTKSREISKPRDIDLELSNRSNDWKAYRQQCCRGVLKISERCDYFNTQNRGFETARSYDTNCDLLRCDVSRFCPYPSGLLHPTGTSMRLPLVLVKQPWRTRVNKSQKSPKSRAQHSHVVGYVPVLW